MDYTLTREGVEPFEAKVRNMQYSGDFSKETGILLGKDPVIWAKNAFLQPITLPGLATVLRLVIFMAITPILFGTRVALCQFYRVVPEKVAF